MLQASSLSVGTSARTGLEPLREANSALIFGSTTIEANSSSAFSVASSTPPRYAEGVHGDGKRLGAGDVDAAEILADLLAVRRHTPFIQSPWICISAVPAMTVLVVSFQARLTHPGSVCAAILRNVSIASRTSGSSNTVLSGVPL